MRCLRLFMSSSAALLTLFPGIAWSQGAADTFPSKPVAFIVAVAAGGPNDQEARLYAPKMSELMRQRFVVDYKPGASGTLGAGYVAKAAPDGYTLLVTSGSFTVFPAFYENLPFDTLKDFAPVSQMSRKSTVLLAHPSFPAKTVRDYIAYAKANPGKINFGTSGAGTVHHLLGVWMHNLTNTKVTFVAYKGTGPQMLDLIGGRLDVGMEVLVSALPTIKSGKVRALGVTDEMRSKFLPDVPTVAEQGVAGFSYTNWLGFVAPGATPVAIVNKLSEAFAKVARSVDIVAKNETQGSVMVGGTPAQFRQLIVSETLRWRKLVKDNGIKLEK